MAPRWRRSKGVRPPLLPPLTVSSDLVGPARIRSRLPATLVGDSLDTQATPLLRRLRESWRGSRALEGERCSWNKVCKVELFISFAKCGNSVCRSSFINGVAWSVLLLQKVEDKRRKGKAQKRMETEVVQNYCFFPRGKWPEKL